MWTEASVKKILQFRIAKGLTVINVLVEKPTNFIETVLGTLWRRTEGRVKSILQFSLTRG